MAVYILYVKSATGTGTYANPVPAMSNAYRRIGIGQVSTCKYLLFFFVCSVLFKSLTGNFAGTGIGQVQGLSRDKDNTQSRTKQGQESTYVLTRLLLRRSLDARDLTCNNTLPYIIHNDADALIYPCVIFMVNMITIFLFDITFLIRACRG